MRTAYKRIISLILIVSMLICATVPVFASPAEEYISDLRIVYAKSYNEAKSILNSTEFSDYKLLNSDLNKDTKEIGVWLAYKTTTDIEEAITDLAVMQMGGGYREGNYQEMIEQSRLQYLKMASTYAEAVDYFVDAYEEGDFLAVSAYRQLNFYTIESEGIPKNEIPSFEGELLGDIFVDGIDESELATIFMEGNIYVLDNIRSLLAMGVSYNSDGKTYLERVSDAAAEMSANPYAFGGSEYKELATIISGVVITFGEMFTELSAHEDDLDYTDEVFTDLEIEYAEYMSMAERMRGVDYLGGKTLYDFCLGYNHNKTDLTKLYPLVAALNDGQKALTRVSHYYDVVRYSMTELPEEEMDAEISKLEETYSDVAFNVYAGVDRTIYRGTYALTSEAYRADAYTESGFTDYLTSGYGILGITGAVSAAVGLPLTIWSICRAVKGTGSGAGVGAGAGAPTLTKEAARQAVKLAKEAYYSAIVKAGGFVSDKTLAQISGFPISSQLSYGGENFTGSSNCADIVKSIFGKLYPAKYNEITDVGMQLKMIQTGSAGSKSATMTTLERKFVDSVNLYYTRNAGAENISTLRSALTQAKQTSQQVVSGAGNGGASGAAGGLSGATIALYAASAILMLYSAISLSISFHNYYNPKFDDVPTAMVDLINTKDGDRYIKYDVVYEAEPRKDKGYSAADLNAYEGKRWNALYYTKSYETGKPLLASEFKTSNTSNTPSANYAAVHRFGEEVCYNLNKYNYHENTSIYLSIKQSQNTKSAVADVPEVVGSIFSSGFVLLAGGLGVAVGIGGTLAVQAVFKNPKKKAAAKERESSDSSES